MTKRIAVIGAGLAGVTAALALQQAGLGVILFDKSRGFGGRLASRRGEGFSIDHGAPAAHGETSEFAAAMAAAGAVESADGGWIGQPGMSAIVRRMAEPLDSVLGTEVMRLASGTHGFGICTADGRQFGPFDRVISTIPAPQARRFTSCFPEDARLASVEMMPTWTLLLAYSERLGVDPSISVAPFESIVRTSDRIGREQLPEAWACHALPDWSAERLELSKDAAHIELMRAFGAVCGRGLPEPIYAAAHRWRYGRVATPLGTPFLSALGGRLLLGGDWALGATAGDAFASGQAMARAVIG